MIFKKIEKWQKFLGQTLSLLLFVEDINILYKSKVISFILFFFLNYLSLYFISLIR